MRRSSALALLLSMVAAGCSDDATTNGTTPTPADTTDAAKDAADTTDVGSDAGGGESDTATDAPNTTDLPNTTDARADGDDTEPDAPRDARNTTDADVDADASADTADANDDHSDGDAADVLRDALADALVCPMFTVLAYNRPGCGANAPPPYCQGSTDACLGPVCGCDGVTTATGCGFSTSPFASWGPCPDAGDGAAE